MIKKLENESQLFIVVVDHRDKDLFQTLANNQNEHELVWGLRPKDKLGWKKVNRGDVVCLVLENSDVFVVSGHVKDTRLDFKQATKWGNDFRTLQMTHMIYFSDIQKIQIPRSTLAKCINSDVDVPGIYKVEKSANFVKRWQTNIKKTRFVYPMDLGEPPAKIRYNNVRYIRDTQKSRILKKLYGDHCQVCHYRLRTGKGQYYSEVHHIRPLNEGGDDSFSNMIVLCPTHHAEFDYGVICLNENLTCVFDINSNKTKKVTIKPEHKILLKNIRYNLKRVGLQWD